ncbi:hypothetical protein IAR55_005567 [Kwoniella newhampshirensis]|uniref:Uncharacterized protein n=1 Tax=Kwoniella newhampshirensis TaxID=1651941 RepID=A0AAW0YU09_9TREE
MSSGYVIQATVLFHLAGRSSVRRFGIKPVGSIESQLRLPMPVSSQQLGLAIEQFDKTLPVAMKSPEVSVDGMRKFAPSTLTIQFFLTAARMYYSDTNTYDGPNDAALYQARHTVDLVRFLLVYIMWVLAAEMLLREVKRLEIRGETLGALALNGDIDFLIQALSIVARDSALLAAELEGLEDNKAWQPEPVTSTNTSSGAGASALLTPRSHLSGQSGIAEAQSHSV